MAALAFENVTLGYGRHPAVHHLKGRLAKGSLTAVVGPNGSGKSTLFKGIMGLVQPMEGHIHLEGLKAEDIAYLPQLADIDRSFPSTVQELVALGLWRRRGLFGGIGKEDRQLVAEALGAVGLSGFARQTLDRLSGGQVQRALFARVLLQDAKLILLDEPFTAIDMKTTEDLVNVIRRWHGESRTVVAVLHDLEIVRRNFPDCLLMAREAVAWGRTEEVLAPKNLQRARSMNEAWDESAPWCEPEKAA
jgi:zinc/manganese transport system ATP-binding protein